MFKIDVHAHPNLASLTTLEGRRASAIRKQAVYGRKATDPVRIAVGVRESEDRLVTDLAKCCNIPSTDHITCWVHNWLIKPSTTPDLVRNITYLKILLLSESHTFDISK